MDLNVNVSAVDTRALGSRPVGSGVAPGQAGQGISVSPAAVDTQDSSQTLEQAVGSLNELMAVKHQGLDFSVDEDTGIQVVKVVARDTGEVIRQLPSEVVLKLAQAASEGNHSLFDGWA